MPEILFLAPRPRDTRIRLIEAGTRQPVRTHPVLFQGRYDEFPVVRVPSDALIYRVDNGRLAAELEEQAAQRRLTLQGLRDRAETQETQAFLHTLLLSKARDPEGPIFAELERLAQQTEPLLVLFDGTVVNGNRRLAAMRQLLAQDRDRYAGFSEIAVAVLPRDIAVADIEYVEAALQMAPETKLGYGWIDRRLKLRKQRDELRLPTEQLMAAYRIENPATIEREIAELELAEAYLRDYCGEPGRYSRVADAEALFAGLQERLSVLEPALGAFWRITGFVLIHGRPASEAPERYARLFPFSPPEPSDLPSSGLRRLMEQFGIAAADQAEPSESAHRSIASTQELVALFRDRARSASNAKRIADTLDAMRLEYNEHRAPEVMLRRIRQAGHLIARLEPGRLTSEQRRSLRGHLAALRAHADYLLGETADKPPASGPRTRGVPLRGLPDGKSVLRILQRMGLNRLYRGGKHRDV